MKTGNKVLTLVNIYAPNNDNPTFFQNVVDHLFSFECEKIIMGGRLYSGHGRSEG